MLPQGVRGDSFLYFHTYLLYGKTFLVNPKSIYIFDRSRMFPHYVDLRLK